MQLTEKQIFIELAALAVKAGSIIMEIYSDEIDYELKKDDSPITAADRASHQVLSAGLAEIEYEDRHLPVLSEEGAEIPYDQRSSWERYWLIDPLDGTKEFINRNGEFTVNIALIEKDAPRLGLVYIPVTGMLYFGGLAYGSWKTFGRDVKLEDIVRLPLGKDRDPAVLVAAGSRSHRSDEFDRWVESHAEEKGCSSVNILTAGSSLKFCLVAEGAADVYPRFGPTMEWDTAAAQAVVEGAGKSCDSVEGGRLKYNKPVLRNSGFIVF